ASAGRVRAVYGATAAAADRIYRVIGIHADRGSICAEADVARAVHLEAVDAFLQVVRYGCRATATAAAAASGRCAALVHDELVEKEPVFTRKHLNVVSAGARDVDVTCSPAVLAVLRHVYRGVVAVVVDTDVGRVVAAVR